jgi:chemotaxis protein histidine kinase CheA
MLDLYQYLNQEKLGRDANEVFSLSLDFVGQLQRLFAAISRTAPFELKQRAKPLQAHVEDLTYAPAENVFREVLSNAEMLARDLNKECPDIVINDAGIKLSIKAQELVRNVFVHVIRNSMDHGIETVAERRSLGKPPKAKSSLAWSMMVPCCGSVIKMMAAGSIRRKLRNWLLRKV